MIAIKKLYLITIILLLIFIIPSFTVTVSGTDWQQINKKYQKMNTEDENNLMISFTIAVSLANTGDIVSSYNKFNELDEKFTMEQFEKALTPYLEKLESEQDNLLILNYAAFRYVIKDNYQEAIKYFNKIIKLDPQNVWIRNYLASCYLELDNFNKAKEILNKADNIKETRFSHLLRGTIHYKKGNVLKALVEYSKSGKLFTEMLKEVK